MSQLFIRKFPLYIDNIARPSYSGKVIIICNSIFIKVGRPSQMPQAQACISEIQAESKKYHRIYVASVHKVNVGPDIRQGKRVNKG